MDYAYKRVGTKSFQETIEAVERAVSLHGFVIQHFHDIQGRLASKGFPIRPLVIFEIAPAAESDNQEIALLMPCRINVYEDGGEVVVAALRPTLFRAVFPEHDLDQIAAQVENVVIGVVDQAVG